MTNIDQQKNGRKTSRKKENKLELLARIKEKLISDPEFIKNSKENYVEDIRRICAKKRNRIHFWAEPHSVTELDKLLKTEIDPPSFIK